MWYGCKHVYAPPTRMLLTGMWTVIASLALVLPLLLFLLLLAEQEIRTQLDDVANNTHDEETDTDGLADLEEFALVGLTA